MNRLLLHFAASASLYLSGACMGVAEEPHLFSFVAELKLQATPVRPPIPSGAIVMDRVPIPVQSHRDGFVAAPILQLYRPLPDNQVWMIQAVLLNPTQGSLANPGAWAAPAKLLSGDVHWK